MYVRAYVHEVVAARNNAMTSLFAMSFTSVLIIPLILFLFRAESGCTRFLIIKRFICRMDRRTDRRMETQEDERVSI